MKFNEIKINKNGRRVQTQGGQVMIVSVLYFIFISFSIISGFVSPAVREVKTSSVNLSSKSSYFFAESGHEDAIYRIKTFRPIGSSEVISLNSNTVTTSITMNGSTQEIVALGDLNSYQRRISSVISWTTDVPFYYGVQVGGGGVDLSSSTIVGNIYANGPITGDSSSAITGTAISASSPAVYADQSNGSGTPYYDRNFADANATQDVAQGFKVATSAPLNKAQVYIKKFGTPANLTVNVVNDSSGSPGTTILATGTISNASVTTSYAWVDVTFLTTPTLVTGTQYWLVVDSSVSSLTRYYTIGASDTTVNGPYSNGVARTGQFNGTWTNPWSPVDYDHFFKIYLGGVNGLIAGSSGSQWNQLHVGTVSGTAQANTVNYTNSTGLIYCQNGTGNNVACTPQSDPQYVDYPISNATITQWQTDAVAGGTISGNYNLPSGTASLGPKKITGNLTVGGGAVLTVDGTLWVVGNISLTGGSQIILSAGYGSDEGVIVSDGTITIGGGSDATGSGDPDSYIMLLTTSSSGSAVSLSGGSGAVILYAPNGTVTISGGADLQEAVANRLLLSGNSTLTYNSGLQNSSFSSGPTMAAMVSPHITSWKETQ